MSEFEYQVAVTDVRIKAKSVTIGLNAYNARLSLWQPDPFRRHVIKETLVHGAYFGIILLAIFTGLLYWLQLREQPYGCYADYVLAVCFVFLEADGYILPFLVLDANDAKGLVSTNRE